MAWNRYYNLWGEECSWLVEFWWQYSELVGLLEGISATIFLDKLRALWTRRFSHSSRTWWIWVDLFIGEVSTLPPEIKISLKSGMETDQLKRILSNFVTFIGRKNSLSSSFLEAPPSVEEILDSPWHRMFYKKGGLMNSKPVQQRWGLQKPRCLHFARVGKWWMTA